MVNPIHRRAVHAATVTAWVFATNVSPTFGAGHLDGTLIEKLQRHAEAA
jgi:hypothetical protein